MAKKTFTASPLMNFITPAAPAQTDAPKEAPAEAAEVGGAQSLLAAALDHEEAVGELLLQTAHDVGGAVGRAILDDKDVEHLFQREDGTDDILDVLLFVICGDDDDAVGRHFNYEL